MAFVNRARRNLLKEELAVIPTPGPGTYADITNRPLFRPSNVTYAPFSTSSERATLQETIDCSPGPGQYSKQGLFHVPVAAKTGASFVLSTVTEKF